MLAKMMEALELTYPEIPLCIHQDHGDRVAVATGSRGIANLAVIARATLDVLRELGTRPFIVAAMGSHGGGTADGQR